MWGNTLDSTINLIIFLDELKLYARLGLSRIKHSTKLTYVGHSWAEASS